MFLACLNAVVVVFSTENCILKFYQSRIFGGKHLEAMMYAAVYGGKQQVARCDVRDNF